MSGILFGVPGKVATLLSRLTNAANLANADAQASNLAPASTAVSTTHYSSARAGYLDQLRASVKAYIDPRRLPLWWDRDEATWASATNKMSTATFWSTDISNSDQLATASVVSDDTYVTVVNVSARGIFVGVAGPIHGGTSRTTTFRITVDGREYIISGLLTTSLTNARLMLWATDSPVHESNTAYTSDGIPVADSIAGSYPLISPTMALIYNRAHVAFSTSLKVEVKISTIPGTTDGNRVLVGYLREKG